MFAAFDTDGDGTLTFKEFVNSLAVMLRGRQSRLSRQGIAEIVVKKYRNTSHMVIYS